LKTTISPDGLSPSPG